MMNQHAIHSSQNKLPGLLAAGLLLALAGCARESIVLVPDPNGHVGKAVVTTSAGTRQLERAGDMIRTSGNPSRPPAVTTADPALIATTFKEALAIEPPPPEKFTLYFETGTTLMTEESGKLVVVVASAVRRRAAVSVNIRGHADAAGSDALNNGLSLRRAKQIAALLLGHGVKPELISVTFYGKHRLAIPTPDGAREPRNRRVEIIVH